MNGSRIRTEVFHHCLVPVQAVITNLESFDDLRHQCLKIAECDVQAVNGNLLQRLFACKCLWPRCISLTVPGYSDDSVINVAVMQAMYPSQRQRWPWA